jgi:hypothetical protein
MDIIQYMETVGEVEVHKGESTAALVQVHWHTCSLDPLSLKVKM